MKKRIGNDFSVSWVITRLGEPESFEPDMPIKVLVTSMTYSWIKIEPVFHVIGNIISFDVPADKQQSGRYRIMLQYQKRGMPQNRTYTVDACNVFELVADSCAEDITEGDVSIASEVRIVQDGKDGLNAYQLAVLLEGFDGTAEEYISSIRKPALDAAGEAVTATRDLRLLETAVARQEELRGTEEALRQTAESTRATTESGRVSTETLRVSAEQARVLSEQTRNEKEETRNENEQERKTSETNRVESENLRVNQETNRVDSETNRVAAETGRTSAETLRASAEQNRAKAETLRVSAETKRGTDFTSFLSTSAGEIKTEVDKVAPVITSCIKATEYANTAADNAKTKADYAKEQADYAKTQGADIDVKITGKADRIGDYIDENQIDPLTGAATSMRTNKEARSGCNLYNWKSGVTYALAFIPQEQPSGMQILLDFKSYIDLNFRYSGGLSVRAKNNLFRIAFYAPNYFPGGNETFFYPNMPVVLGKINLIVFCAYDNCVKLSLNGSVFLERKFVSDAYPDRYEYGASPIIVDNRSLDANDTFAKICSFREFNYVVSEQEKNEMWNFGSPDKFMTPAHLKSNLPDLPIIGTFNDLSLRTNETINVRQEEGCVAVVEFLQDSPVQWLNVWRKRSLKNVGCKYRVRLAVETNTPVNFAMYAHMAGNEYGLISNLKNGINGNIGNDLVLEYDIILINPGGHMGYFEKVSGGALVGVVIKIKEISIVQQLSCTGEYLTSGFRHNKLIDTSGMKRDIAITTGNIELLHDDNLERLPEREIVLYKKIVSDKKLSIANIDYDNCLITFAEKHDCKPLDRFITVFGNYGTNGTQFRSIPSGLAGGFRIKEIIDEYIVKVEDIHGSAWSSIANIYPTGVKLSYFTCNLKITHPSVPIREDLIGRNFEIEFTGTTCMYPYRGIGITLNKYIGDGYSAPYANCYFNIKLRYCGESVYADFLWARCDDSTKTTLVYTKCNSSKFALETPWNAPIPELTDDITIKITKINE